MGYYRFTLILLLLCCAMISCDNDEVPEVHFECDNSIVVQLIEMADAQDDCRYVLQSTAVDFLMVPLNLFDFRDMVVDGQEFSIRFEEMPDMVNPCASGRIVNILCLTE